MNWAESSSGRRVGCVGVLKNGLYRFSVLVVDVLGRYAAIENLALIKFLVSYLTIFYTKLQIHTFTLH
jgi:hypothetical protein